MNETKSCTGWITALAGGGCGGVAEHFNRGRQLGAPIWVALCLRAPQGWLYVAAALLLPKKNQVYPAGETTENTVQRPPRAAAVLQLDIGIRRRH